MKTLKTIKILALVALVKVAYEFDTFAAMVKVGRKDQVEARQNAKLLHDLCMADLEQEALKLL